MTSEKILAVAQMYRSRLEREGILKIRMNPKLCFKDAAGFELLQHAHYLLDGLQEYAKSPEQYGKANRHLTAIQMCLSFAGWYTLEDLMHHNMPHPPTS